mgnify:CR=1 FL=1
MQKFVPEILQQVNDAKTKAERIRLLEANNIRPIRNMLALNFDKNIEIDLPEGAPPYSRDEKEPIGMSNASLYVVGRRLARCLKSDPLPKTRKEAVYIQILEGVHWQEADLLNLIKDRNMEEKFPNITREIVRKAFPTLLTDVQPNQFTKEK